MEGCSKGLEYFTVALHDTEIIEFTGGIVAGEPQTIGGNDDRGFAEEPILLRIGRNERGKDCPLFVGEVCGQAFSVRPSVKSVAKLQVSKRLAEHQGGSSRWKREPGDPRRNVRLGDGRTRSDGRRSGWKTDLLLRTVNS